MCVHEWKSTHSHSEHTMTLPWYYKEQKVAFLLSSHSLDPPGEMCHTHYGNLLFFLTDLSVDHSPGVFSKVAFF